MLVPAFSSFPTIFSKSFFLRVITNRDCVVKSSTNVLRVTMMFYLMFTSSVHCHLCFLGWITFRLLLCFICIQTMLHYSHSLTLSQTTNFRLTEFADDNFKFDENGRKFSRQVANTMGKGEIMSYEQFHLFPQCFQKTCTLDT